MSMLIEKSLTTPMSEMEFQKVFAQYKQGDISKEEILLASNIRLLMYIINYYYRTNLNNNNKEDIEIEGTIGLLKAIRTYDPDYQIKFSTYATSCIKNEINQYLQKDSKNNITISTQQFFSNRNISEEKEDYNFENDIIDPKINIENQFISEYYILSLIQKLPKEYQEIAKLYIIKGLTKSEISNILTINITTIDNKISKLITLLKKIYIESDLTKDELIIERLKKIDISNLRYLQNWLKQLTIPTTSQAFQITQSMYKKIEQSLAEIGYSLNDIQTSLNKQNITIEDIINSKQNIDTPKDLEIINCFANLTDLERKIIIEKIKGTKQSIIRQKLNITSNTYSEKIRKIKKKVPYTDIEIKDCLTRNNIINIYNEYLHISIDALTLLNIVYKDKTYTPKENAQEVDILTKFDKLEEKSKQYIWLYLSGKSFKEISEIVQLDNKILANHINNKIKLIGYPKKEIRLALARKRVK